LMAVQRLAAGKCVTQFCRHGKCSCRRKVPFRPLPPLTLKQAASRVLRRLEKPLARRI
jgi:hypothetical protein